MQMNLSKHEFELMQKCIQEYSGIAITEDKAFLIESRLSQVTQNFGLKSYESLYYKICFEKDLNALQSVIDAMTTNETFWFRDQSPWNVLENRILPELIKDIQLGKRKKVRIWSAASSSGQEAYSTAMCIDQYLKKNLINDIGTQSFEILATDISSNIISMAKEGNYDNLAIERGLKSELKDLYFKREGGMWCLDDRIRNMVTFRQFNLQRDFAAFDQFNIIFCRYVLIYFSEELKKDIIRRFHKAMEPSGILFLGNSELFLDSRIGFDAELFKNDIFYRKL